ncbi:MAG: ATP-binding protein [Pseudomonadota bacterium]
MAMLLIACVLVGSFAVLVKQISYNEKDAYIINISGMQRMLSQRTALMAREIYHANTPEEAALYANKMRAVTDKMRDNHERLSTGNLKEFGSYKLSPQIQDMYFGETALAKRVDLYIGKAEVFLKTYDEGGLEAVQQNEIVNEIVKIARNGLLRDLNAIVFQYETEAQDKVLHSKKLQTIFLSIGLITVLIVILFIFRPMVKRIVSNIDELEHLNKELLEFSYRISHDLRAPIVSSLGLIGLSKRSLDEGETDTVIGAIPHIEKSLTKLENLIEGVIMLTKMKMSEIKTEEVDVKEMITEIIEKVSSLPHAEKIDFQTDIQISEAIHVQKLFVNQTLENFISNAVKYADPDEKAPFVKTVAKIENGECTFSVEDNGLGVPEEYRDQLFGMFKRFHTKVSFGSGLGLYLVKQNAVSLGGDAFFTPMEKGSKFTLKFPYNP